MRRSTVKKVTKIQMCSYHAFDYPNPIEAGIDLALTNKVDYWKVVIRILVVQGSAKYLAIGDSAGCVLPVFTAFGERCSCILCRV